jgi:hypothetical protein
VTALLHAALATLLAIGGAVPDQRGAAARSAGNAGTTGPAGPARVGIIVQLGVNISHEETTRLTQGLTEALREALVIDVVSGYDVTRRMPHAGVKEDCIARKACIQDLAARLDADQLLFLVVVRVGARIQIDSTWAEVANGRTVPRDAILIEEHGEPRAQVFARAARSLIPNAELRPVRETAAAAKPLPTLTSSTAQAGAASPFDRLLRPPVLVAAGVGLLGVVGGAAFGLSAKSTYDGLVNDHCDKRACPSSRVDTLSQQSLAADLCWLGAVAGGAAAALLVVLGPGEGPSVAIGGAPGGARVQVSASF